jgi:hypothetical protein
VHPGAGDLVAVAEPTTVGRVIAAWPSFALIGSYELLMRQIRRAASPARRQNLTSAGLQRQESSVTAAVAAPPRRAGRAELGLDARRQAWLWAVANRSADGSLPSGKVIADRYGRHERWGRLVKAAGIAGEFAEAAGSALSGSSPSAAAASSSATWYPSILLEPWIARTSAERCRPPCPRVGVRRTRRRACAFDVFRPGRRHPHASGQAQSRRSPDAMLYLSRQDSVAVTT